MSSCRFFGMRASRIPRLLGASLVGFSRPQSQPIHRPSTLQVLFQNILGFHRRLAARHRCVPTHRLEVLHGAVFLLVSARHFTPPSASVSATATPPSAVATPAAALEPVPSALPLSVASLSSITALSAPDNDDFTTVLSKWRRTRTTQATMVGVSSPQLAFSEQEFPAFRIPLQDGFQTSYNAVAVLEEDCPTLVMSCLLGKDGSSVILPKSTEIFQHLQDVAVNCSTTRGPQYQHHAWCSYVWCLPTELLLHHPQVKEATRCQTPRTKEATRQVTVTLRGLLLPQLSLGSWGTSYLRPWVPEPLWCYRCHRFGHHQASCANVIKCGICSESHETQECLVKYKA